MGPYSETGEDVILKYYNKSQVDLRGAELGTFVDGVFITKAFKNHVSKLTDQAIGECIPIHVFAQELYEPSIRKKLESLGIRAKDEYPCNNQTMDKRPNLRPSYRYPPPSKAQKLKSSKDQI